MESDLFEAIKALGVIFGVLIIFYLLPKLFELLGWIDDIIYPNKQKTGIPKYENPPPPPPIRNRTQIPKMKNPTPMPPNKNED